MPIDDDLPRPKPPAHALGEDLSRLSEHELEARIALLKAEIGRVEAVLSGKRASRDAAAALFKK